jgi:hypothetical protein
VVDVNPPEDDGVAMSNSNAINRPMAGRIQALIDHPKPMTPARLELLKDSSQLGREERIAGMAQVFRIAESVVRLAIDDHGNEMKPGGEGRVGSACAFCDVPVHDLRLGWHHGSCRWASLVESITGMRPTTESSVG